MFPGVVLILTTGSAGVAPNVKGGTFLVDLEKQAGKLVRPESGSVSE